VVIRSLITPDIANVFRMEARYEQKLYFFSLKIMQK